MSGGQRLNWKEKRDKETTIRETSNGARRSTLYLLLESPKRTVSALIADTGHTSQTCNHIFHRPSLLVLPPHFHAVTAREVNKEPRDQLPQANIFINERIVGRSVSKKKMCIRGIKSVI